MIKSAAKWIEPFIEERMVFGRGFLAPSIQYIKIPSGKHPSIRLQMEMPRDRIAHVFSVDRYVFDAEILRSEEHTSELQSLMRISYAVFCLKKNTPTTTHKQRLKN